MNSLVADTQLVNAIAQKVGFGSPQFMAHLAQTF